MRERVRVRVYVCVRVCVCVCVLAFTVLFQMLEAAPLNLVCPISKIVSRHAMSQSTLISRFVSQS